MRSLYQFVFYTVFLCTFLIGGFLQFFVGIPNTMMTFVLTSVLATFYILYALVKQKIVINKLVISLLVYALVILISAFVNQTHILKVIIYLVFPILPLSAYLFFKINQKENYISSIKLSRLFLALALIQYPIILIQTYGFEYIIPFSRSSQYIVSYDFLFGSFFLKADHALGFFLLLNILNLIENNKNQEITKYPIFMYLYLGFTIFASESNVSKLLLVLLMSYLLYKLIPKKIRSIGLILVPVIALIAYPKVKEMDFLKHEVNYMKAEYDVKHSYRNYEREIAKRPQIIIAYTAKVPTKWIGEGPYDYFNVLKGKFTGNGHFSQLIWTYNDLGIIGLIVLLFPMVFMVTDLNISGYVKIILILGVLIYSLMTTIFFDLAIVISLASILRKNYKTL